MLEINKQYLFDVIQVEDNYSLIKKDNESFRIPTQVFLRNESANLLVTSYDYKTKKYFFSQKSCSYNKLNRNNIYTFYIDEIKIISENKVLLKCFLYDKESRYSYNATFSSNILVAKNMIIGKKVKAKVNQIFKNEIKISIEGLTNINYETTDFIVKEKITDWHDHYFITFNYQSKEYSVIARDWQYIHKDFIGLIRLEYDIYFDHWKQLFSTTSHPKYENGNKYSLIISFDEKTEKYFLKTNSGEKIYSSPILNNDTNSANYNTDETIELIYKGTGDTGNLYFDIFIDFQTIVNSSKADYFVFKRILENDIYNVDYKDSKVLYEKFRDYYNLSDNRWIIAYVNYLAKVTEYYLSSRIKDYRTTSYLLETSIDISIWILDSDYEISKKNKEKIESEANRIIVKNRLILKAIELIFDNKAELFINDFIEKINTTSLNDFKEIHFLTILIRQLDYDEIDHLLIKLIYVIGKSQILEKAKSYYYSFFEKLIFERIRRFEKILFLEVFSNKESRDIFFKKNYENIEISKKYFNFILNLLKDNKRANDALYKMFLRGMRQVHHLQKTEKQKIEIIHKAFQVINDYQGFKKVKSIINWDAEFDDYISVYDKVVTNTTGVKFENETLKAIVVSISKENNFYVLNHNSFEDYEIILPFHLSYGYLKVGDNLSVKRIAIDNINKKILTEKSNEFIDEIDVENLDIKLNSIYSATVKNITEFGLFVIVQKVEGLVLISEISNTHINRGGLNDLFSIGQKLKVKLIQEDEVGKYFFSIRQAFKLKKHEKNSIEYCKVISHGYKHVNTELSDGAYARLRINNISDSYINSTSKYLKIGERVKCKIIDIKDDLIDISINFNLRPDYSKEYKARFLHNDLDQSYYKIESLNLIASEKRDEEIEYIENSYNINNESEEEVLYSVKLFKSFNKVRIKSKRIYNKIDQKKINLSRNIEYGYLYENLSYMQSSLESKIHYLEFSMHYFSLVNSARAYYLKIYIYYVRLIKEVKNTVNTELSIKNLKLYSIEILKNLNSNENSIEVFPIINEFKSIVKIISKINEDYIQTTTFFLENSFFNLNERSNELAKSIMTFNLTKNNSKFQNEIWLMIKTSLSSILEKLYFDINDFDDNYESRKIIEKALNSNEGKTLEFKASIFIPVFSKSEKVKLEKLYTDKDKNKEVIQKMNENLKTKKRVADIKTSFLKAVAALMNSEGGQIIIGIDEDESSNPIASGVNLDLQKFKNDQDEYLRNVDTLISNNLGKEFSNHYKSQIIKYQDNLFLLIDIKKSEEPVFIKIENTPVFFVRDNNQCQKLFADEMYRYLKSRFLIN